MGGPNEFKTFPAWEIISNFIIFIIHSPVLTFNQYIIYIQHFSENRSSLGSSGMHHIQIKYHIAHIINSNNYYSLQYIIYSSIFDINIYVWIFS